MFYKLFLKYKSIHVFLLIFDIQRPNIYLLIFFYCYRIRIKEKSSYPWDAHERNISAYTLKWPTVALLLAHKLQESRKHESNPINNYKISNSEHHHQTIFI